MSTSTKSKIQMFGAWCGILYVVGIIAGFGLTAGFAIPLHLPGATANEIAAIFQTDGTRIRIGMLMTMLTAMIVMPFSAVVSQFLARIEGGAGVLTYSALLASTGLMVLTFYPAIFWLVAAYRPDRAADIIYLMNDLAWLQFIGGVTIFLPLPICTAIAAFCDSSSHPVFPRWSGYLSIWCVLAILPDQLIFFFHTGPFAWNGLFGFWIPAAVFGAWFPVTSYLLRNAILRDRRGPPVIYS